MRTPGSARKKWTPLPDTGCDLHPACLSCPLPVCRYDGKKGLASIRVANMTAAALRLRADGLKPEEIAEQIGRGRRTVFRLLAEAAG